MSWDDDIITTYEELLERVDEYTLYCFYLGFSPELDMSYRSPIRIGDLNPSWSLFVTKYRKNVEYMWKDHGGDGRSGDVFTLVKLLYGLTTQAQVLARIKSDFKMGPMVAGVRQKLVEFTSPTPSPRVDIRVKSKAFDRFDVNWWKGWGVSRELLEEYKVSRIRYYFKYVDQENALVPNNPSYAYLVMGKYKLYFPFERKQNRFRTDMSDRELEGFQQLRYDSALLIITKSLKDIMCLRGLGYEAVSPRGEHGILPGEFIDHFQSKYSHIITLFDNDGKHRKDYPYPEKHVPLIEGVKDITDFHKKFGASETAALLNQLTDGYLHVKPGGDRQKALGEVPW